MNPAGSAPDDLHLPAAACALICIDLAQATRLDAAMAVIDRLRQLMLGDGLLTVNLVAASQPGSAEGFDLERLWSSNTGAYPVAGRKRKTLNAWARQLLQRGEVFIAEGDTEITEMFDDHARIAALGLQAIVNLPLYLDGRCVATLNVLGSRPKWQPHEILFARLLGVFATPWVVAHGTDQSPVSRQIS